MLQHHICRFKDACHSFGQSKMSQHGRVGARHLAGRCGLASMGFRGLWSTIHPSETQPTFFKSMIPLACTHASCIHIFGSMSAFEAALPLFSFAHSALLSAFLCKLLQIDIYSRPTFERALLPGVRRLEQVMDKHACTPALPCCLHPYLTKSTSSPDAGMT